MDEYKLKDQALHATASAAGITRHENCSVAAVRRVAAMLDIDPDTVVEGAPLPRGWQFFLMAADTRRASLRADGFPGLGVPIPELGLPRLLLGGRSVEWLQDIPVGAALRRTSGILGIEHKNAGTAGAKAIVTLFHELRIGTDTEPALAETQTYLLLGGQGRYLDDETMEPEVAAERVAVVQPDETLLFQYSALGFNSHKIHLDREHACNVEGFPDLVVNGGLATLLLTEFLRRELGLVPTAIKTRHVAPLFCNRPVTLAADRTDGRWRLRAYNSRNRLAVDMEVTTQ